MYTIHVYIYVLCDVCRSPINQAFSCPFLGSMRCETMPVHQNGWFLLLGNKSNKGFEVPEKISNQITVADLEAAFEDGFQACHFFYWESGRLKKEPRDSARSGLGIVSVDGKICCNGFRSFVANCLRWMDHCKF